MKRSIQDLAACAMTTGYSGIALAQPAPAEHQQHQQHAGGASRVAVWAQHDDESCQGGG